MVKKPQVVLEMPEETLEENEDVVAVKKKKKKTVPKNTQSEKNKVEKPTATEGAPKAGKKRKAAEAAAAEEAPASPAKNQKVQQERPPAAGGASAKSYREAHQIIVEAGCPDPMQSFDAAEPLLGTTLVKALRGQGYSAPTPIQAQAWPIALRGEDLVGVAKTGSGKTCGFLLPALRRIEERGPTHKKQRVSRMSRPTMLVIAPTRELAQQIAGEAQKFAPTVKSRVVAVYGGVPKGDQVRELSEGCDILLATPGRLLDFMAGDKSRQAAPKVSCENVNYLVLDEADKMLDMGFEADIRKVVKHCLPIGKPSEGGGAPGPDGGTKRQTLFFTATWPKAVQSTAASLTHRSAVQIRIGQGAEGDKLSANANVTQTVIVLEEEEKLQKLKEVLKKELGKGETAMIFVGQKATCDTLETEIRRAALGGLWCEAIHSGRSQWDRDGALAKFRELTSSSSSKGERGVLVATDVASRGLDIPGVALVVVYDFGRCLKSGSVNGGAAAYVHRIGRTGRAGKKGRAVTFFTSEDLGAVELVDLLKGSGQEVPKELLAMVRGEKQSRRTKDRKQAHFKRKFSRW